MTNNRVLLDAFADARRSWDDLVSLQPDIYAGGGNLRGLDLAEFARRVGAHQASVDTLADALEIDAAEETIDRSSRGSKNDGIRETTIARRAFELYCARASKMAMIWMIGYRRSANFVRPSPRTLPDPVE